MTRCLIPPPGSYFRADLSLMSLSSFSRPALLANKIHVAKDGVEALEYVFAEGTYSGRDIKDNPQVILLDLKLPRVSGLEVLRKIKSDERTKVIPIVVLTSSTEERDIIESYELGVNSYIVKPVDFDKFINAVSEIGLYWMLLNKPPVKV